MKERLDSSAARWHPDANALEVIYARAERRQLVRRILTGGVALSITLVGGWIVWNQFQPSPEKAVPEIEGIREDDVSITNSEASSEASLSALQQLPEGWTELSPPPVIRARATSIWIGDSLFYWGGDSDFGAEYHSDGARYVPATGEWQRVSNAPISGRSSAASVWTGDHVLIWGGHGAEGSYSDGAAFAVDELSWRRLPPSPLTARSPAAYVWTGRNFIVWGNSSGENSEVDGAIFDPRLNVWSRIANAPTALNEVTAVWTGKEMIVLGAYLDSNNSPATEAAVAMAYRPDTNTWREVPPPGLSPQASTAVWLGERLMAWDWDLRAVSYDPDTNVWEPQPSLPFPVSNCLPVPSYNGEVIFAKQCDEYAFLNEANQWLAVPDSPIPAFGRPVAAGPVFLIAGAAHEGSQNGFVAYKPA